MPENSIAQNAIDAEKASLETKTLTAALTNHADLASTPQNSAEILLQLAGLGPEKTADSVGKSQKNKLLDSRLLNGIETELRRQLHDNKGPTTPQHVNNLLSPELQVQKLHMADIQAAAQGKKNPTDSISSKTTRPNSPKILVQNADQSAISKFDPEPLPAQRLNSPADASNTAPGHLTRQLFESIRTSLQQGQQQITVRLNPPELGRVLIKFSEQDDQIIGMLRVDRMDTKQQLDLALPEIVKALQDSGVQLRKLEVVLDNQPQQHLNKDQSPLSSFTQQHPFSENGHPSTQPPTAWDSETDTALQSSESQFAFTESSINVLV
jgi:flagellar hook-length control protein FliK